MTRPTESCLRFWTQPGVRSTQPANMCEMLKEAGCTRLYEGEKWKLEAGRGYYVTRNGSALIAFFIPKKDFTGFQIMGKPQ